MWDSNLFFSSEHALAVFFLNSHEPLLIAPRRHCLIFLCFFLSFLLLGSGGLTSRASQQYSFPIAQNSWHHHITLLIFPIEVSRSDVCFYRADWNPPLRRAVWKGGGTKKGCPFPRLCQGLRCLPDERPRTFSCPMETVRGKESLSKQASCPVGRLSSMESTNSNSHRAFNILKTKLPKLKRRWCPHSSRAAKHTHLHAFRLRETFLLTNLVNFSFLIAPALSIYLFLSLYLSRSYCCLCWIFGCSCQPILASASATQQVIIRKDVVPPDRKIGTAFCTLPYR